MLTAIATLVCFLDGSEGLELGALARRTRLKCKSVLRPCRINLWRIRCLKGRLPGIIFCGASDRSRIFCLLALPNLSHGRQLRRHFRLLLAPVREEHILQGLVYLRSLLFGRWRLKLLRHTGPFVVQNNGRAE